MSANGSERPDPAGPGHERKPDVTAMVADLFDNDVVWDADDTDEFLLQVFRDLEASGAQLTAVKDLGGNSLLHMAALWNRRAVMEEIVRRGADVNAKNRNGHTPLDLAAHWGHFELALQLQHYGGKHTCEHERDIAVAQRDLAQQRNAECEAEAQDALRRLTRAKQEREAFRVERDRLVALHSEATRACDAQADQLARTHAAVAELTAEKHALRVRTAQLADALRCEQAARANAVQGWRVAEDVVAGLQRLQEDCREREEEALGMRNAALEERDAARGLARQAQVDQGIARQLQLDAARERDSAVAKLLEAESAVARDRELWSAKVARAELERRNIQVEIDRQTELLRGENAALEKQLGALAAADARQRQAIEDARAALTSVQRQLALDQRELAGARESVGKLEEQVRVLLDERRDEHRAWRQRLEQSLQQALASELRTLLEATVTSWRKLHECQELVYAFDVASLSALFHLPSSDGSAVVATAAAGGGAPTGTPRQGSVTTASAPSLKTVLLPAIQDKSTAGGLKDGSLTPRAPPPAVGTTTTNITLSPSFVTHNYDPPLRFTHDPRVQLRLREAETALLQQQQQSDPQSLRAVADHVTALCRSLAATQAVAQDKMIERKDELLQRFTQHRQDKPKKTTPARFRDCSVRPSM
ncbi:hypothetical protein PybrP1_006797 [[Pythium] brassicae (nom. inval.)]|nr:hypothetical protein PybrP1_006797 [[Pythium] brassicae (nom. inval.)]